MDEPLEIRPQKGAQEMFVNCKEEICIYGGAELRFRIKTHLIAKNSC